MSVLSWIQKSERVVGRNSTVYADTLNRALRDLLSRTGIGPDTDPFPGIEGPVFHVAATGALGDGITDDTGAFNTAITNAVAAGGGVVRAIAGKTHIVNNVQLKSGVILDLRGSVLKQKAGSAGGTPVVNMGGTILGTSQALTANVATTALSLAVADSSGFAVDDLVLVRDNTYKDTLNSFGRNQEMARVASTGAGVINLEWPLYGSYTTAQTATVYKLAAVDRAVVRGGKLLIPSGTSGGGVFGDLTIDCLVEDVWVVGPNDMPAVRFDRSLNPSVYRGGARDGQNQSNGGGFGYGLLFNESTIGGRVVGFTSMNLRENPCASNNARHCTFELCNDFGAFSTGFGTHGTGCEHIAFRSCRSFNSKQFGFAVNDGNNTAPDTWLRLDDCESYNSGKTGFICSGSSTCKPVHVSFKNCKADGFGLLLNSAVGLEIDWAIDFQVDGGDFGAPGIAAFAQQGILIASAQDGYVRGPYCHDIANGYGIQVQNTTGKVLVDGGIFRNCSSYNVRSVIANADLEVRGCKADDNLVNKLAGDKFHDNDWGGKFDDQLGSAAGVTDGSTIAHSLVGTPTEVFVQTTVASQMASVTAVAAGTFTVAIKTDAGAAGTAQTIYWRAAVRP